MNLSRTIRARFGVLHRNRLFSKEAKSPYYNKVQSFAVEKTPITAQLWKLREDVRNSKASTEVDHSPKAPVKAQINYHFLDDTLRDLYVDLKGEVLLGKLFEDFDSIAGNIAFAHCFNKSNKDILSLVTASVDYIKISENKALTASMNYCLCGKVVWVGRSSLEVVVELHEDRRTELSDDDDDDDGRLNNDTLVLSSVFTYVARDKTTKRAYEIMNKLDPKTAQEIEDFNTRDELMKAKKALKSNSKNMSSIESALFGSHHSSQHFDQLLALKYMEKGRSLVDMPALSSDAMILMSTTSLENSFITQPQNVNTAGKVFGGLLIHRAYDLALATSYTFAGEYPKFEKVEEISFKHPVDVGDLVKLKSRVVHTRNRVGVSNGGTNKDTSFDNRSIMQVEVTCQIIKLDQLSSVVTNTFDFVFSINGKSQDKRKVLKEIAPATLEEAVAYLKADALYTEEFEC